jgi:hypothetical protein
MNPIMSARLNVSPQGYRADAIARFASLCKQSHLMVPSSYRRLTPCRRICRSPPALLAFHRPPDISPNSFQDVEKSPPPKMSDFAKPHHLLPILRANPVFADVKLKSVTLLSSVFDS